MSQITLKNITKRFGAVTALNDVSFEIQDGEFFVLLGPTGAGKTTTLRVIAGLTKQEAGSVVFDDAARRCAAARRPRRGVRLPAVLALPDHDGVRQPGLPAALAACARRPKPRSRSA